MIMGKNKKAAAAKRKGISKLRKKGDFVSDHGYIPQHFEHEIDPDKMNRAQRRLFKKGKIKQRGR
jgi:hypothetical protein